MQYVLLIYQGSTWDRLPDLTGEQKASIGAEYAAINTTSGVTPGPPLGLPDNATTVRVEDGKTVISDGPYAGVREAVGGSYVVDAADLDAAIELATRIPAARLGGAIEIRPVGTYW